MSRTRIFLIACSSLALAVFSAYVVHPVLWFRAASALRTEVDVVVAAHDLQIETALSERDVILTKVQAADAPLHCVHDTASLLGRRIVVPVSKGAVIFPYELGGYGDPIPSSGMHAVRLEIKGAMDLPEVVQRGSRVDILVVQKSADHSMERTTTVLKNVPVLAVTRNSEPGSGSGRIRAVVALLLSPNDALQVAIAKSKGRIQVLHRIFND